MIMYDEVNVNTLFDDEKYTLLYIYSTILERGFLKLTFKEPGMGCALVALESDIWEMGWSSVAWTSPFATFITFITTEAPVVLDFSEDEDESNLKEVCIAKAKQVIDYIEMRDAEAEAKAKALAEAKAKASAEC